MKNFGAAIVFCTSLKSISMIISKPKLLVFFAMALEFKHLKTEFLSQKHLRTVIREENISLFGV
nr:hypothetical protein [uncultured Marinifilum sp.]